MMTLLEAAGRGGVGEMPGMGVRPDEIESFSGEEKRSGGGGQTDEAVAVGVMVVVMGCCDVFINTVVGAETFSFSFIRNKGSNAICGRSSCVPSS